MLTSAKQTFAIRGQLCSGLCIQLVLELGLVNFVDEDKDQQFSVLPNVFWFRSSYLVIVCAQLHAIFIVIFKDYEKLNHQLLQNLVEKVHALEASSVFLPGGEASDDSWTCEELEEDECDPDYTLPEEKAENPGYVLPEEKGESSITTSNRRYNLMPRR